MHATDIRKGPRPPAETLTRRAQAYVRSGLIPPAPDAAAERRTLAAVAVLSELHDKAGIRSRDMLRQIFDRLTSGEAPLIDALIADAREGTPVLVLTHWSTADCRAATSFVFKLTADLDAPIMAPGDEWEATLEGVLSLAPLFDKMLDSQVVPFRKAARQ